METMNQENKNGSCDTIQHFSKLLKQYWSITNKQTGGQGAMLDAYYKFDGAGSLWFGRIKSSEAAKYLNSECHSETEARPQLKEVAGPLKTIELIKLASLLLAYNNSLIGALQKKSCIHDKEEQSITKNLSSLVEKMSRAIETFLAFIPWDYTSCEKEMQDLLPSLETAINEFSALVDAGNLENVHLEQQMVVYDVDILCAVLGLRMDFASYLKKMKAELWFHQEESYHILNWINNFEENMFQSNDVFYNMGFTEKKSKFILNYVPAHLFDLQSPLYWAESYTESMFRCHPLLCDSEDFSNVSEHIDCQYTPENTPFEACINVGSPVQCEKGKCNIINGSDIECLKVQSLIDDYINQHSLDGHTLLFYGTYHESAAYILKDGIRLLHGEAYQDFFDKEGLTLFYSYQNAKEWAKAQNFDSAVLVFQIPDKLLKETDNDGRDLTPDNPENRQEWEETVKFCRKGSNGIYPARFESYSFIKGPLCANPNDVKKGETPLKHSGINLQFCLKKKKYAAEFGKRKHILCAVFYRNRCNC